MRRKTNHTRNFIVFSLLILTVWLVLPRTVRRAIQPEALAAAKTFTVNVTGDGDDANPGDGICATAAGNCSLRAAIREANQVLPSNSITIKFNIPGSGVKTISPASPLIPVDSQADSVLIDGYSQPGASPNTLANGDNAVLLIQLDGANAGASAIGLLLGDHVTVQGLTINHFDTGVQFFGLLSTAQGNFIGTDPTGTSKVGNNVGINAFGTIGGTIPAARNLISGNNIGIATNGNANLIQGNFIGSNAAGTGSIANGEGISLSTSNNIVGGSNGGNLISGNSGDGIFLTGGHNQVQGNLIGTDVTGQNPLPNGNSGITITGSDNSIGGPVGAGNTIAFNLFGGITIENVDDAILSNSIFANANGLGIAFSINGVPTPNDPGDADTGPNNLQNFPVISSAVTNGSSTVVTGAMDTTPNTGITIQFFANTSCDPSGNGEGQTFVGSINKTTGADGHFMFSATMMSNVTAGQFITATATDSANNTSEFSQCRQVTSTSPTPTPTPTPPATLQFGQAFYSTFEDCTAVTVTVARTGDTSTAASVDYATQPGTASDRSDFNTAIGTLTFAPGETAKSFDVLVNEDSFTEATETLTVSLSNPSGATLGTPAAATIQIFDDAPEPATNAIDPADGFVGQHYHDFLNRQSDTMGLDFWANQIEACGADSQCRSGMRVNVSGAFFLSIEFQETGGFAIRVQRAAFGKKSVDATKRITYSQFIHDARFVGDGVIVGQPGYGARLEANKQAYINQIVTSAAFTSAYASGLTADQFVDALFASAGITPTSAERQAAINAFDGGGIAGRAAALRSVSDSGSLRNAEFSPQFVLMQYFGYLRRNPTDAPDNNDNGYQFWLAKLNNFNGDFQKAEMVKAFISSIEYRSRFGQP